MEKWRLILDEAGDAYWNMAVDEALFRMFCAERSNPAVRFYTWTVPSISLGRFQKPEGSVDAEFCLQRGIPIVRRPTGGRAVLHGTDLTFSIVKRNDGCSVAESYQRLSQAVTEALTAIGVPVQTFRDGSDRAAMRSVSNCFDLKAPFEVAIDGCKILGSAQVRNERATLQQNSLILEIPSADNRNAFRGGDSQGRDPQAAVHVEKNIVIGALSKAFEHEIGVRLEPSGFTRQEDLLARELVQLKYSTEAWNLLGSRDFVDTPSGVVIY